MRVFLITAIGTIVLVGLIGVVVHGQSGQAAGPAAAPAPRAPADKAGYWPNAEIQAAWKDLEAKQVINKRVMDGGAYSINVRIVKEGDAPLVHSTSADVWVMQAGTATAITGGQLVEPQKRPNGDDIAGKSISGGSEQPVQAGDVLYVPPGVAHGFKNVKGFRAFLIRFETK